MSEQPTTTTVLVTTETALFDDARLAVAGFLARFSEPPPISCTSDLRAGSRGAPATTSPCPPPNAAISNCGSGAGRGAQLSTSAATSSGKDSRVNFSHG
jgi:hypothetical protein